jgi:hypothetical protein
MLRSFSCQLIGDFIPLNSPMPWHPHQSNPVIICSLIRDWRQPQTNLLLVWYFQGLELQLDCLKE